MDRGRIDFDTDMLSIYPKSKDLKERVNWLVREKDKNTNSSLRAKTRRHH